MAIVSFFISFLTTFFTLLVNVRTVDFFIFSLLVRHLKMLQTVKIFQCYQ